MSVLQVGDLVTILTIALPGIGEHLTHGGTTTHGLTILGTGITDHIGHILHGIGDTEATTPTITHHIITE